MSRIKVLVVDDSVVIRKLVTDLLGTDPDIEVVGTAVNGLAAQGKVELLGPDIRSVHLKDARRPTTPGHWGEEVPLGQGEVDIPRFLDTLEAIGYAGPLMIEREVGDQAARIRDIADGLDFVREHLSAQ